MSCRGWGWLFDSNVFGTHQGSPIRFGRLWSFLSGFLLVASHRPRFPQLPLEFKQVILGGQ